MSDIAQPPGDLHMVVRKIIAIGAFDPARRRKVPPGQARASVRKRYAQAARRAALKLEAYDRGVDISLIIREHQEQVGRVVAEAAAATQKHEDQRRREAEKRRQWNNSLECYTDIYGREENGKKD